MEKDRTWKKGVNDDDISVACNDKECDYFKGLSHLPNPLTDNTFNRYLYSDTSHETGIAPNCLAAWQFCIVTRK